MMFKEFVLFSMICQWFTMIFRMLICGSHWVLIPFSRNFQISVDFLWLSNIFMMSQWPLRFPNNFDDLYWFSMISIDFEWSVNDHLWYQWVSRIIDDFPMFSKVAWLLFNVLSMTANEFLCSSRNICDLNLFPSVQDLSTVLQWFPMDVQFVACFFDVRRFVANLLSRFVSFLVTFIMSGVIQDMNPCGSMPFNDFQWFSRISMLSENFKDVLWFLTVLHDAFLRFRWFSFHFQLLSSTL